MVFKVKQDGQNIKKTAYIVSDLDIEGMKDVLGIWIGEAESSRFWLGVPTDLKNRGIRNVLIASVDGLKGFSNLFSPVSTLLTLILCLKII